MKAIQLMGSVAAMGAAIGEGSGPRMVDGWCSARHHLTEKCTIGMFAAPSMPTTAAGAALPAPPVPAVRLPRDGPRGEVEAGKERAGPGRPQRQPVPARPAGEEIA